MVCFSPSPTTGLRLLWGRKAVRFSTGPTQGPVSVGTRDRKGAWLASLCSHTSRAGLSFSQGSLGLCNSSHGALWLPLGPCDCSLWLEQPGWDVGTDTGSPESNLFLSFSGILAGHLHSKMSSLYIFFRRIPLSMQG